MDFDEAPLAIQGLHGQAAFAAYPTEPPWQEVFNDFPMVPALPGGHPSPAETGVPTDEGCPRKNDEEGKQWTEGEGHLPGLWKSATS